MKAFTTVLSVAEIHAARAFYEDLFGLELYQDYGRNLTFTCGLSLQQDFHWLTGLSRAQIHPQPTTWSWPLKRRTWMDSSKSCGPIPTCKPWAGGGTSLGPAGDPVLRPGRPPHRGGRVHETGHPPLPAAGMTPEEIARKMDVSLKDLDILLSAP